MQPHLASIDGCLLREPLILNAPDFLVRLWKCRKLSFNLFWKYLKSKSGIGLYFLLLTKPHEKMKTNNE